MVTDTASLVELIKNGSFDTNKITSFSERFFDIQDGKATERIVENIFGVFDAVLSDGELCWCQAPTQL